MAATCSSERYLPVLYPLSTDNTTNNHFQMQLNTIQPEASWASSAKWEFGGISVAAKNNPPHRQMRQDSPLEFQGLIVHISLPFI